MADKQKVSMEEIVSLAKRRGFVFQASEIYGGIGGFWDWGPYGTEMVNNIRQAWWSAFVYGNKNVVGLDSTIIQNPKLWVASGHVDTFVDPMVDCKNCKHRFRADHVAGIDTNDVKKLNAALKDKACPNCGKKGTLTEARQFNMMFKTNVGPIEDDASVAYLRPETAGGIFAQFQNVRETTRQKIPFGIAQIGKAFRNEITPGDFIFRVREFEQMELEYFVEPEEAEKEYARWKQFCMDFLLSVGLRKENLQFHDHAKDERAHYAAASVDIQYNFPMGFKELWGIANRTDFDLKAHSGVSGKDLTVFDEAKNKRYIPYVIEPSIGIGRLFLALVLDAYNEEKVGDEARVVLKLHPSIAPVKVAVLPLSKNEKLTPLAEEVWKQLSGEFKTEYDETQSIGRRYRRQDEIGTPLCVTVDFDSLEDKAVTIRHRDSMKQDRVKIKDLNESIKKQLAPLPTCQLFYSLIVSKQAYRYNPGMKNNKNFNEFVSAAAPAITGTSLASEDWINKLKVYQHIDISRWSPVIWLYTQAMYIELLLARTDSLTEAEQQDLVRALLPEMAKFTQHILNPTLKDPKKTTWIKEHIAKMTELLDKTHAHQSDGKRTIPQYWVESFINSFPNADGKEVPAAIFEEYIEAKVKDFEGLNLRKQLLELTK